MLEFDAVKTGGSIRRGGLAMTAFEIWVGLALLGLWSCVGVIYRNSRKSSVQMDEVVRLLGVIANKHS